MKTCVNDLLETLRTLRLDNGLYLASTGKHYVKVWVRDSFYESLPELYANPNLYKQTYHGLLDYYIYQEIKNNKLKSLINSPTKYGYEFNHPRCWPDLEEIDEEWGFKQLDNYGELLYGIWLGENQGIDIIRGPKDRAIINLIIKALEAIEYWHTPDNGIWEENEEVRASSIGAVMAGLTAIRLLGFNVSQWLIDKGHETLKELGTRETATRESDLALLTLIYPFNIVSADIGRQYIKQIETDLVRELGAIRYIGDKYYNIANPEYEPWYDPSAKLVGGEMRWLFAEAFLYLSHKTYGNHKEAEYYKERVKKTIINGKIAEGNNAKTGSPNPNNPLGWCLAMAILSLQEEFKFVNES